MDIEFTSADYVERLEAENAKLRTESREFRGMDASVGIADPCPSCGQAKLFVGTGGHLTCSGSKCKNPCAIGDLPAENAKLLAEIDQSAKWMMLLLRDLGYRLGTQPSFGGSKALYYSVYDYALDVIGNNELLGRSDNPGDAPIHRDNAKLRDLLRGEEAVAEECAKIVEKPSGEYSVGHRKLPYWDGEKKAAEIRKRFGGKA